MQGQENIVEITASFVRKLTRPFENGWGVIVVCTKEKANLPEKVCIQGKKASGYEFTAVGFNLLTEEGTECKYSGVWDENKYGTQLKVYGFEEIVPDDFEGRVKYLSSSRFRGIGKKIATNICLKFGENVFEVISKTPERLLEVNGITERKMSAITSAFRNSKDFRELSALLVPLGFDSNTVSKIANSIGTDAADKVTNNPYILLDTRLCGFKMADRVAKKLGIQLTSGDRISSAILYSLREDSARNGHMYSELNVIYGNAMSLLNDGFDHLIVTQNDFVAILNQMVSEKTVSFRQGKLFTFYNEVTEHDIAANMLRLRQRPISDEDKHLFEEALKAVLEELNFRPSGDQIEAVKMALFNRVSVITGGPGTGKTTILRVVIQTYQKMCEEKDEICEMTGLAPTGKARSRMAQATDIPCFTIHSRCGIGYAGDDEESDMPDLPENSLIIVDEMSMVDSNVMSKMLKKIPTSAHLILVGDADQLPSVGPGAVLNEILNSGVIPSHRLTEIFRQAEGSSIVDNSSRINSGRVDLICDEDFTFIPSSGEENALEIIKNKYLEECQKYGIDNVSVLCPLRHRRQVAVDNLNSVLQNLVNPASPLIAEISIGNRVYRVNDRVIQMKNTQDVANGDIGIIQRIFLEDPSDRSSFVVVIKFENDLVLEYAKEEMQNVELAYCLTIHKSQGTEYESVIIPILSSQFCKLFRRNILYTGVTRAKRHLTLIGDTAAVQRCILTTDDGVRNTTLAARLKSQWLETSQKNSEEREEEGSD